MRQRGFNRSIIERMESSGIRKASSIVLCSSYCCRCQYTSCISAAQVAVCQCVLQQCSQQQCWVSILVLQFRQALHSTCLPTVC